MRLQILSSLLALCVILPSLALSADRKMVIQVTSSDRVTQKIAINSAKNLKNAIGKDGIDVEIVVAGPGLSFLKSSGPSADELQKIMSEHGVKVSVCGGTLKAYAKRHDGKLPDIIDGVTKVPTGAIRILELQEQGYAYLRP